MERQELSPAFPSYIHINRTTDHIFQFSSLSCTNGIPTTGELIQPGQDILLHENHYIRVHFFDICRIRQGPPVIPHIPLRDPSYAGPDLALVFFKIGTEILHVFLEIQTDIDGKSALSIPIEHGFLEIDDLTGSIRKKLPKIASVLLKTFLLQEFPLQSAEQILKFLL